MSWRPCLGWEKSPERVPDVARDTVDRWTGSQEKRWKWQKGGMETRGNRWRGAHASHYSIPHTVHSLTVEQLQHVVSIHLMCQDNSPGVEERAWLASPQTQQQLGPGPLAPQQRLELPYYGWPLTCSAWWEPGQRTPGRVGWHMHWPPRWSPISDKYLHSEILQIRQWTNLFKCQYRQMTGRQSTQHTASIAYYHTPPYTS